MIGSSRSYAIGLAHFQMAGGFKTLIIGSAVYLSVFGAGLGLFYYIDFTSGMRGGITWVAVAMLLGLEMIVLVIFGSFRVSGAIRLDVTSRMIESHRLMPIPTWRAVAGYLIGATTHATCFALLNVILAFILAGATRTSLTQVIINQLIVFVFAALLWSAAGVGTLLFRHLYLVGFALLIFGGCGIVYAYMLLPGLAFLITPFMRDSIFDFSGSAGQHWVYGIAIAAQIALITLFFIGACRAYRGTYRTVYNILQSILLLGVCSATSAAGIALWDEFHFGAGRGGGFNSDPQLRYIQIVASLLVSMLVTLLPLRTLVVQERLRRTPFWRSALLLLAIIMIASATAAGVEALQHIQFSVATVTCLTIGAFVISAYAALRLLRNKKILMVAGLVGAGIFAIWLFPLILELLRIAFLAAPNSDAQKFGVLGTFSPIGSLIAVWITSDSPPTPIPGLIGQWLLAAILAFLAYLFRDAPIPAPVLQVPATPPLVTTSPR